MVLEFYYNSYITDIIALIITLKSILQSLQVHLAPEN
jgi:hypothetical protein